MKHVKCRQYLQSKRVKCRHYLQSKYVDKRYIEVCAWVTIQILITAAIWLLFENTSLQNWCQRITYEKLCLSDKYTDVILAQISTSFIVVSLTSILSSNSKIILWEDRIELNLKQVGVGSFVAHTTRIFTSLMIGIWLYIIASVYIYVNFLLSIFVTLWFTVDLIRVNYDDNSTRKHLDIYFDFIKENAAEEYYSIQRSFEAVTDKYVIDHNIEGFYQNILFLEKKSEWETIEKIFLAVGNDNLFILVDFISNVIKDKKRALLYQEKFKNLWEKIKNESGKRHDELRSYITKIQDIENKNEVLE